MTDKSNTPVQDQIPAGFWKQIDHQLERIRTEYPNTFARIREILLDPGYDEVLAYTQQNGTQTWTQRQAFFAGSGGDDTLFDALLDAGWMATRFEADYDYTALHPGTGQVLRYTEGDLEQINEN